MMPFDDKFVIVSRVIDPPRLVDVPAIVIAEFASAEFGTADNRELLSVPLDIFEAFVASVVALVASPETCHDEIAIDVLLAAVSCP
jgi:hypothetical protein